MSVTVFGCMEKAAYAILSRDWSADVCSSDLVRRPGIGHGAPGVAESRDVRFGPGLRLEGRVCKGRRVFALAHLFAGRGLHDLGGRIDGLRLDMAAVVGADALSRHFAEISVPSCSVVSGDADAILRRGEWTVEIRNSIDPMLLCRLLEAVSGHV